MDTQSVSTESSAKNGVTTPGAWTTAAPVAATPAQLAKQSEGVVEAFQEWTVSGRRTSAAILPACAKFDIFQNDADYAKNNEAKLNLDKALGLRPDNADQHRKRYRSIGAVAPALTAIQDALPHSLESIYEVSKAFGPGKDTDKQNILAAVKDGRLTTRSSLEDIRAIRNLTQDKPAPAQRTARSTASTSLTSAKAESAPLTDEQIVQQAKAQGITSPEKQQEVVKQVRQAESAEAAPAIINATPPSTIASENQPTPSFRSDVEISDLVVADTSISGRFLIHKKDGQWNVWAISDAIKDAVSHAHI